MPAANAARGLSRSQFFVQFFVVMAAAAVLVFEEHSQFQPPVRSTAVADGLRYFPATQPADLAELRLLIELPALRKLVDRGLSDEELGLARKLADITMRAARRGDLLGYQRADMAFHLCLLELTGDPALSDLGRLVLAPDCVCAASAEESKLLLARDAREHAELVGMFPDAMVRAADHLLRLHLSRLRDRTALVLLAEPASMATAGA
jgi:DNA-binding GntR family transcriptional regulator